MAITGRRAGRLEYPDQISLLAGLIAGRAPRGLVDERRVLQAAAFHRLVGYQAEAAEAGTIALSADARRRVAGQRLDETVKGRVLRREAEELGQVLKTACGAPPVLIKGPAVADRV